LVVIQFRQQLLGRKAVALSGKVLEVEEDKD
jgi:hypothetical protein